MHGVQPIAKTAPSVNAAPKPDRPPTSRLPTRPPIPPSARRGERHAAGRRGEARRGAGVERPPGSLEDRDAEDPREAQAHDHEDRRRR